MLRLTRKHKTRVSNGMAVFAAALLMITAAASVGDTQGLLSSKPGLTQAQTAAGEQDVTPGAVSTQRMKKKFKVSLMLLPRR